jgi:DNA primase
MKRRCWLVIPKSFIQDLLNRLDIVDVIERYVPLKKAGANYSACCPFHNEKSPSFTVSQTKQFYHCFGCGAHGTAISFVMEHLGLGYVDAIEELARSVGLAVPNERPVSGEAYQKVAPDLYEVMQTTTRYYREQLKLTPRAIDYLKQRGLNGEIAAKFGIGYAPDAWQNLAAAFPNYADETLHETGLVVSNDEGKRYDRFRDRIMFPIINVRGQVIGFGGRVLDKGEPKYLNSPETPLFEKGHELYGLFQAQKAIRTEQKVLVVEGYMDVVALAQLGVEYAVATLGTATTPYHIQKLLRITEHIVFSFDGDRAGQKAAWRALENALPYLQDGKKISFLFLPTEHDPDSFIREFGKAEFDKRVQEAMPLSAYLLREISTELDLRSQEGRNQLLQRAKPLLTAIVAPAASLLLRKELAALSGISQAELEALYEIKPVARATRAVMKKSSRTQISPQRTLLRCLIAQPNLASQMQEACYGEGLEAEAITALLPVLRETNFTMSSPALIQYFQGSAYEKLLAVEQVGVMEWGENFGVESYFLDALKKLASNKEPQQRQELESRLGNKSVQDMNAAEREEYMRLLRRS